MWERERAIYAIRIEKSQWTCYIFNLSLVFSSRLQYGLWGYVEEWILFRLTWDFKEGQGNIKKIKLVLDIGNGFPCWIFNCMTF